MIRNKGIYRKTTCGIPGTCTCNFFGVLCRGGKKHQKQIRDRVPNKRKTCRWSEKDTKKGPRRRWRRGGGHTKSKHDVRLTPVINLEQSIGKGAHRYERVFSNRRRRRREVRGVALHCAFRLPRSAYTDPHHSTETRYISRKSS